MMDRDSVKERAHPTNQKDGIYTIPHLRLNKAYTRLFEMQTFQVNRLKYILEIFLLKEPQT